MKLAYSLPSTKLVYGLPPAAVKVKAVNGPCLRSAFYEAGLSCTLPAVVQVGLRSTFGNGKAAPPSALVGWHPMLEHGLLHYGQCQVLQWTSTGDARMCMWSAVTRSAHSGLSRCTQAIGIDQDTPLKCILGHSAQTPQQLGLQGIQASAKSGLVRAL